MSKFKVGDRVKCIEKEAFAPVGAIGTVIYVDDICGFPPYGIEWDKRLGEHSLFGRCKQGHGEWVNAKDIELIKDGKQIFINCKDNRVISIIKENGKEISRGIPRCNPEDEFDFEYGVNLATERDFNKLKELKVGDKVKIVNAGKKYSEYVDWFKESNNMDLAPYYRYGVWELSSDEIDGEYTIKAIYPHSYNGHIICAICVYGDVSNGIYLISAEGLEKEEN